MQILQSALSQSGASPSARPVEYLLAVIRLRGLDEHVGPPTLLRSFGGTAFACRRACPAEAFPKVWQAEGMRRLASPTGFEPVFWP